MHEYWIDTDVSRLPVVKQSPIVFEKDSGANKIGVRVTDHGEPLALSGTIRANIVRGNGSMVVADGARDGNRAWVILPASAYAYTGKLSVFIKMLNGNDVVTLGGIEAKVYQANIE